MILTNHVLNAVKKSNSRALRLIWINISDHAVCFYRFCRPVRVKYIQLRPLKGRPRSRTALYLRTPQN